MMKSFFGQWAVGQEDASGSGNSMIKVTEYRVWELVG